MAFNAHQRCFLITQLSTSTTISVSLDPFVASRRQRTRNLSFSESNGRTKIRGQHTTNVSKVFLISIFVFCSKFSVASVYLHRSYNVKCLLQNKTSKQTNKTLRRRANARNVSFRISLRWPIHIINSVDKTKLSRTTPHRRSTTVSLETYPLKTKQRSD